MKKSTESSVESISECYQSLGALSDELCLFAHENSVYEDPSQCPAERVENILGCAHGGDTVFRTSIERLVIAGLLSGDDAKAMLQRIDNLQKPLLQLDINANREYEYGQLSHVTLTAHVAIIEQKMNIRNELMVLCRDYLHIT